MLVSTNRKRLPVAIGRGLPKPRLGDELADVGERKRASGRSAIICWASSGGTARINSKSSPSPRADRARRSATQYPPGTLWVAAGDFGRQLTRRGGDWNPPGLDRRAAVAFRREPREIERKSIAAIDAGVQRITLVKKKRLFDTWVEVEVFAEDAAAEFTSHDDLIPGLRAAAQHEPRAVTSPMAVTLIASGPSQLFVSPPAIAVPSRSASGIKPS